MKKWALKFISQEEGFTLQQFDTREAAVNHAASLSQGTLYWYPVQIEEVVTEETWEPEGMYAEYGLQFGNDRRGGSVTIPFDSGGCGTAPTRLMRRVRGKSTWKEVTP